MGLRFDRNQLGDPMQQLKQLIQTSSEEEYQRQFEKLRAQAKCSEPHALSMFLGGLKRKLAKLVATHSPHTVLQAYNLAKLHEDALLADSSTGQSFPCSSSPNSQRSSTINKPGSEESQSFS